MEAFIFAALAFAALGYGAGYNRGWIKGADEMVGHIEVEPDPIQYLNMSENFDKQGNVIPLRKAANG